MIFLTASIFFLAIGGLICLHSGDVTDRETAIIFLWAVLVMSAIAICFAVADFSVDQFKASTQQVGR